ncbi:hypothetical protein ACFVZW_12845 [Streptomyces sp. NPDC059567]|uniref:hypothetical protein n=1 Tax=Streptomyces sp. NPDC059567 TaxID=3346867 RepID=UPI00369590EE
MSFDDEWAGIRSAAAEKAVSTRLNQLPADGGGGSGGTGRLRVEQADLAAVGDAAFTLHQRLDTDGDHAKANTYAAAGSLKTDFALGAALSTVADKWNEQVGTLLDACAHISNHLEYSKKTHADDEYWIATRFKFEQLDKGFEERARH